MFLLCKKIFSANPKNSILKNNRQGSWTLNMCIGDMSVTGFEVTVDVHYRQKYWIFGLAPTTNKYCDFNATLTCNVMHKKCNLRWPKLKMQIIMYRNVSFLWLRLKFSTTSRVSIFNYGHHKFLNSSLTPHVRFALKSKYLIVVGSPSFLAAVLSRMWHISALSIHPAYASWPVTTHICHNSISRRYFR